MLEANPTRIVLCREVCDVNTFKIATSLIITGVELTGQFTVEAKCKIAFKIACPPLFARAKECSLELRLARSSQGSVARAKALVEIMKNTLLARARKASLERASKSGVLKELVFFQI